MHVSKHSMRRKLNFTSTNQTGPNNHFYYVELNLVGLGMEIVRIFYDRIRDRICLEEFRFVRIRVRIFNI